MGNLLGILPPLGSKKKPTLAAILGFLTGGIGLMFYFGSLPDLFVCVVFVFILVGAIPFDLVSFGLPTLVLAFLPGIYGYVRASSSNARLEGR
jgi:hypothetical protein